MQLTTKIKVSSLLISLAFLLSCSVFAEDSSEEVEEVNAVATPASSPEVKTELKASVISGLQLSAIPTEGASPFEKFLDVNYYVYENKKDMDGRRNKVTNSSDAKPLFTLAEGEYFITATRGNSTAEKVIRIKEGEGIEHVFNLKVGNLKLSALASETSEPFAKFLDVNYYVYAFKKDIDGHRKKITNSSDAFPLFKLLAGKYIVVASRGNATSEATIDVKAGEMIAHRFNLNTGNLKLQALPNEGAEAFAKFLAVDYQVYSEKTDRDGNYIKITNSSDAKPLFKLAAGNYILVATRKDTGIKVEVKLEIKAGELLEQTLVISESSKATAANETITTE